MLISIIIAMDTDEWNERNTIWLNSSERRALEIIARSVGMLTLLGASYIIQDITKGAARRKLTKNRIILFMSICDFISVFFSAVLGSLMILKDTGVPGARINEISCNVLQGFIAMYRYPRCFILFVSLAFKKM